MTEYCIAYSLNPLRGVDIIEAPSLSDAVENFLDRHEDTHETVTVWGGCGPPGDGRRSYLESIPQL